MLIIWRERLIFDVTWRHETKYKSGTILNMGEETEWLKKAAHDLNTAEINLNQKVYDASAFFCQQAIEKALKALHIKKFGSLVKTHDLHFLGQKVGLPADLLKSCDEISSFYVETRYPDSYAEFDEETVRDSIAKARKVLEWTKRKL